MDQTTRTQNRRIPTEAIRTVGVLVGMVAVLTALLAAVVLVARPGAPWLVLIAAGSGALGGLIAGWLA